MELELRNKRALVTGGSRGIGKAIARGAGARRRVGRAARARRRAARRERRRARQRDRRHGRRRRRRHERRRRRSSAPSPRPSPPLGGGIDILVNAAAEPGGYAAPPKLAEIDAGAPSARDRRQGDGLPALRARGRARHEGAALGPHRQHQRPGRAPERQHRRQHPQRRGGGADQEPGRRARAGRHQRHRRPPGPDAHRAHRGAGRRRAPRRRARAQEAIEKQMAEGNSIRHLVDAREVADVVAFLCSPRSVAINGDAIAVGGGAPRAIHY